MGVITENHSMVGLRGDVGKIFVYKQRDGKTIVSKVPKKPSKSSNIQAAHRNGFKKAIKYAKKIKNNNLDLYGKYEEMAKVKHLTAYNLIVKDYLSVPEITDVNVNGYNGTVGSKITIEASDVLDLPKVMVEILKADGTSLEAGKASLVDGDWVYTATIANSDRSGTKIHIKAYDIPGNVSEKEVIL